MGAVARRRLFICLSHWQEGEGALPFGRWRTEGASKYVVVSLPFLRLSGDVVLSAWQKGHCEREGLVRRLACTSRGLTKIAMKKNFLFPLCR